jgi:hypothetical protein
VQEDTKPTPQQEEKTVELQEVKPTEPTQEELAASLLHDLSPGPLPDAIQNADEKQLEEAEATLKRFNFSFPIRGLLDSYKELHAKQEAQARVMVGLAIQTGRANQFVEGVVQAQKAQKAEYEKKLEAMKTLGINPEQMQQPPQATAPQGGMNMGAMMQFLPEIMKAFSAQPAPQPASTLGLNFAEIGAKFVNAKLEEALNPAPDPLAEVGKLLLTQAASKVAASAALK